LGWIFFASGNLYERRPVHCNAYPWIRKCESSSRISWQEGVVVREKRTH